MDKCTVLLATAIAMCAMLGANAIKCHDSKLQAVVGTRTNSSVHEQASHTGAASAECRAGFTYCLKAKVPAGVSVIDDLWKTVGGGQPSGKGPAPNVPDKSILPGWDGAMGQLQFVTDMEEKLREMEKAHQGRQTREKRQQHKGNTSGTGGTMYGCTKKGDCVRHKAVNKCANVTDKTYGTVPMCCCDWDDCNTDGYEGGTAGKQGGGSAAGPAGKLSCKVTQADGKAVATKCALGDAHCMKMSVQTALVEAILDSDELAAAMDVADRDFARRWVAAADEGGYVAARACATDRMCGAMKAVNTCRHFEKKVPEDAAAVLPKDFPEVIEVNVCCCDTDNCNTAYKLHGRHTVTVAAAVALAVIFAAGNVPV